MAQYICDKLSDFIARKSKVDEDPYYTIVLSVVYSKMGFGVWFWCTSASNENALFKLIRAAKWLSAGRNLTDFASV